ncbi:HIRAN domain-containing protein [Paenibacillus odorifer]|uniref:HIRAN domain-containing protein n=1 Tax=Paenibacillus odorifer TaxID=189426 RepID=UPI002DBE2596|nr:HIRAN domain-containing protein [Paenibacillus odorifer]MEC0131515.1 HIRAN domain-containing protein [Paenibacillus odorifer]MEC0220332.1 HIRAN domain-containing protein [Paenibacillus odorifer]
MKQINKLLINWKGPKTKSNYAVGQLSKVEGKYIFQYNKKVVDEAENEGFSLFVGFSDIDVVYESDKLFSIFERRIPDKNRSDFKKFMEAFKDDLSDDLQWDYLRYMKGNLATDTISFISPVILEKESGFLYLVCEIAGWSITRNNLIDYEVNKEIEMVIDNNNPKDKEAIELFYHDKDTRMTIGFVPKPFNELFYRLMKKDFKIITKIFHKKHKDNRPLIIITSKSKMTADIVRQERDLQYMVFICE